jgi:hypothetical protein
MATCSVGPSTETFEVRVFRCPCSNLLRLRFHLINGEVRYLNTLAEDNSTAFSHTTNIWYVKGKGGWNSRRLWIMGTTSVKKCKLVSCRKCSSKHSYKKFQKVDI